MKHVLKPYDNRSDRQFDIVEIVFDFFMTRAARATKFACENRKQKSYRVNRPLEVFDLEVAAALSKQGVLDVNNFIFIQDNYNADSTGRGGD